MTSGVLKSLRHRAGLFKYNCLAGTLGRSLAAKAERARANFKAKVTRLPPVHVREGARLEIHMVCSASSVDMGTWASWSFLRFMPDACFYLHGDRSLTGAHLETWRSIVKGLNFVTADEDDARAAEILKDAPRLSAFREALPFGRKLVDVHLAGKAAVLLLLDSDVLCFNRPDALLIALSGDNPTFRWNRDLRSTYAASESALSAISNSQVPSRLNSGLIVVPRFDHDMFQRLENWLTRLLVDLRVPVLPWIEQSLYAMAASTYTEAAPLPPTYDVVDQLQSEQIVRHYVGNALIRPLFYLEGVPSLLRDVSLA